jgi:hypothetical protein
MSEKASAAAANLAFVVVRGTAAVSVVRSGVVGVSDLGGNGLGRSSLSPGHGAVFEAAQLLGPRRDDDLDEQAGAWRAGCDQLPGWGLPGDACPFPSQATKLLSAGSRP